MTEDKPELEKYFQGFNGAFVLYDLNNEHYIRYNPQRCAEGFLPASTFKILNSLIGLETGVIPDENYVIQWDGTHFENPAWNQDHSLKTAFQNSVVWYYQELARRVGKEKMQYYVDAVGYGNKDITGRIDSFWLDGALRISADEQVELLKRLYQGNLPFSQRSMKLVKEIMVLENADNYRLSGKTGSGQVGTTYIGWFVGYVEERDNVYFFATNIESASPEAKGVKAKEIAQDILQNLDLLPGPVEKSAKATPTSLEPPPATLEINGARQTSGVGAFCWDKLCSDPWGVPTPSEALTGTSPVSASLLLPTDKSPGLLRMKIVRVFAEDKTSYRAGGLIWWDINPFAGDFTQLLLQREQSLTLRLEKGLYVLSIHAVWNLMPLELEGDVVYGFLVEIK